MDAATLQTQSSSQSEAASLAHPQLAQERKSETENHLSREYPEAATRDRRTSQETQHEESAEVVINDAHPCLRYSHCPYARAPFALAALVLTIAVLADVGVACSDLREYDPHPDSADSPRDLLALFAVSLLECIVMVLFLLWELRHCASGPLKKNAESETRSLQLLEATVVASRRRSAAWKLVLLEGFAFWTVVLYMYVFINPEYGMHHLALHVKFMYVTLLRIIVFSLFALAKLW